MADLDTGRHQSPAPKAPSGRHGGAARSQLPHGIVHHADIHELLRNSAMHFGGNDATVARLLDAKEGVALRKSLNHFTDHDARRLAYGLLDARRHASAQSRDLYTAAIHHMGYRFDEHGHIHKMQHANFSAAMKNPAFRAHTTAEHYVAAHHPNAGHEVVVAGVGAGRQAKSPTHSSSRGAGSGVNGIDRSGRGGSLGNRRAPAPKP